MKEQRIPGRVVGQVRFHKEKPSRKLGAMQIDDKPVALPTGVNELVMGWTWQNDVYYGTLRRYDHGSFFDGGEYALIGIAALSEDALHDWRDFQHIKTELVGREWEAVELYPAESRCVDTSNFFYLWCFPPGVLTGLGLPNTDRHVEGPADMKPAQRPFPEDT